MIVPDSARNVRIIIRQRGVCIADFVSQQAEEDGCHRNTGDAVLRVNRLVRVADNVRKMIIAIEHIRHAGCLPACVDRLVADHLDIADLGGQLLIRIPTGKYGAEHALHATASVGSRFASFF